MLAFGLLIHQLNDVPFEGCFHELAEHGLVVVLGPPQSGCELIEIPIVDGVDVGEERREGKVIEGVHFVDID